MNDIALLTPERLRSIVADCVQETIKSELPAAIRRGTGKPYLTKAELMQLTGWSSRQVEYRKANRSIPFVRRGRTILFPTDEIYAFLEEGRVDAE